ncbi:MAG: citramalate synthase [Acidobacteriaceae bacterium]|nr:citramalate synthase [Acidobacteriaceae bacterium]MBV9767717.1 citramalate synthase [Acidobacteriaceae bacterium]
MKIFTLDTTLRDGTQGESISFSADDKLLIAEKLDELGIDYIEGGWPGSNPKDKQFFERAQGLKLKHAKLTAFGATRFAKNRVDEDSNVAELLAAQTPAVSVFGKTWDFHVQRALAITETENLQIISDTVSYLKDHGREVIYDAEHFFDGYVSNAAFALRTLEAAKKSGADVLCLCDTNGGTLPSRLVEIVEQVRRRFDGVIGIHCHNDSELAVANTLLAVEAGVTHVQGCMNGYGERCGNANLCSILAILELKLGHDTIGRENLKNLTSVARFVAELANLPLRREQAFVGKSAFAHKGGVHVSAVLKDAATYEHIQPELVGNRQRVLLSDLSGRGNISYKLEQLGLKEHLNETSRRELLNRIKGMEHEGYDFETAEGTFELLVREAAHPEFHPFSVVSYEVSTKLQSTSATRLRGNDETVTTASVALRVGEDVHSCTATGQGPVHALDVCLRQCLASIYPAIANVRLIDYKVRVLGAKGGTASKVRVLVEWSDHRRTWTTVGVSDNVIDASWRALVDALRLELMRLLDEDEGAQQADHDYSWAV